MKDNQIKKILPGVTLSNRGTSPEYIKIIF